MARIYLSPPHLSGREAELVAEAIASNWIAPLGPHVDAFERELAAVAGVEHAVALSSGTAALISRSSCSGSAPATRSRAPLHVRGERERDHLHGRGAVLRRRRPGDVDDRPGAARPRDRRASARRAPASARCSPSTSTASAATTTRSARSARATSVVLVQDAAESLGATYRGAPAGGQGALAAFSFNGNKIITTSGGGMLVSANRDWVEHARKLSTQAREPVPHYEHVEIGFNYRMSNLLAALGRAQLESLPERVAARRRIRDRYRELLDGARASRSCPRRPTGRRTPGSPASSSTRTRSAPTGRAIRLALEAEDIEARPLWKPMHLQPVFASHHVVRRRRLGAAVRARALPAERLGADRGRSGSRRRDGARIGREQVSD